jgi:hypothetical protein
LREFKRLDGKICHIAVIAVAELQLTTHGSLPVVQFRTLDGVLLRINLAIHAQFQQCLQLSFDLRPLAFKFSAVLGVALLLRTCASLDNLHKPGLNRWVLNTKAVKNGEKLRLDLAFRQADPGVTGLAVLCAAVVAVLAPRSVRRTLANGLTRDDLAAVPTAYELAGEGNLGSHVDLLGKLGSHGLKGGDIDNGFKAAFEPLSLVLYITDVVTVVEHAIERGPVKLRLAVAVDDALTGERFAERIQGEGLVGEEFKHTPDFGGFDWVVFDDATAVHTHVAIAVLPTHG